jgi:hypothetical protein
MRTAEVTPDRIITAIRDIEPSIDTLFTDSETLRLITRLLSETHDFSHLQRDGQGQIVFNRRSRSFKPENCAVILGEDADMVGFPATMRRFERRLPENMDVRAVLTAKEQHIPFLKTELAGRRITVFKF